MGRRRRVDPVRTADEGSPPAKPGAVAPVDVDGVLAVTVGTALWALAFVVLLPFRDRLEDNDAGWWLATCLAGVGLGIFGIYYCRRRRDRLARPPAQNDER